MSLTDEKFGAARAALKEVAAQIALDGHITQSSSIDADWVAAHNVGVDRAIAFINRAVDALKTE